MDYQYQLQKLFGSIDRAIYADQARARSSSGGSDAEFKIAKYYVELFFNYIEKAIKSMVFTIKIKIPIDEYGVVIAGNIFCVEYKNQQQLENFYTCFGKILADIGIVWDFDLDLLIKLFSIYGYDIKKNGRNEIIISWK